MVKHTERRLPLTSDIVFKRVFSKEGNKDILKSLLKAILEIPIQDVMLRIQSYQEIYMIVILVY